MRYDTTLTADQTPNTLLHRILNKHTVRDDGWSLSEAQRGRHAPQWRQLRQDGGFHVAAVPFHPPTTTMFVTAVQCAPPPPLHRPTYNVVVVVVVVVCTTITDAAAGRFHMCVSNTPRRRRTSVRGTRVPGAIAIIIDSKNYCYLLCTGLRVILQHTGVYYFTEATCRSVSDKRHGKTNWSLNQSRHTFETKIIFIQVY